MFFFWNANAARANVTHYEQRLDKIEFKDIIQAIDTASKCGLSWIKWRAKIRKNNLKKLKNLGYKVNTISDSIYEIFW